MILPLICSCEKQIELELPSADPKLVVDGWFTNEPAEDGGERLQTIRLTKSLPYFATQSFPVVKDALVILKDSKGNSFPLNFEVPEKMDSNLGKMVKDEKNGRYEIRKNLEKDISYTLYIKTKDGKEYESSPQKVISYPYTPKITVEYHEADDMEWDDDGYYINYEPKFLEEGNYYFTWQLYKVDTYTDYSDYENPREASYNYPLSDMRWGSNVYTSVEESQTYFDQAGQIGEKYFIKQNVLAKEVYDYLRLAEEQRDNEGTQFSPPPAPLRGNIKRIGSNNLDDHALGFFIISSVQQTKTITISE
jgi:hypothetical protein